MKQRTVRLMIIGSGLCGLLAGVLCIAGLAGLATNSSGPATNSSGPAITIDFLDIGQGDATLIQRGSTQLLIDGGPDRLVLTRLGRALRFGDRRLETVLATHPHDDHTVGLEAVLERYQVDRLVIPDILPDHDGWTRLLAVAARRQVPVEKVLAGDRFIWAPNLQATVLWPPPNCVEIVQGKGGEHDEANSCSLVLLLEGQAAGQPWRALLMGDGTTVTETELLKRQAVGPVEILKVGHHGSRYSSSAAFLETVRPAYAVVSVGEQNRFGHPDQGVLLRLAAFSGTVWRTDRDWGVRALFGNRGLEVTVGHGH